MVKRYAELCMDARKLLSKTEGEQAAVIARELVACAAEKTVEELLRDLQLYASDCVIKRLGEVLEEYLQGKPLAYILGQWSFYGLPMKVTPDVLIPRDDTMVVTALALDELVGRPAPRVLDLCTGSGCIGIAIACKKPKAKVTMADISDDALRIAKENAATNGLTGKVSIVKADCREPAPAFLGKFDVIVSNPPYITADEMKQLDVSVKDYEPTLALYGGEDGLDFYRCICKNYRDALADGGCLCLEFGMGQESAVEKILIENNFGDLQFSRDTSNIIRAVVARKNRKE